MVWWRRVDDGEPRNPATGGDAAGNPAHTQAERGHQLSRSFSGDSYWSAPAPADGQSEPAAPPTEAPPAPAQPEPPAPIEPPAPTEEQVPPAEEPIPEAGAQPPAQAASSTSVEAAPSTASDPLASAPADPAPVADPASTTDEREAPVADYQAALNEAMKIDGAMGVALVDSQSGMALATAGNPQGLDLNVAAAGNSNVVQSKLRTMRDLNISEKLEDILITLDSQYHIIRTFGKEEGLFLYLVLDKTRANLAMARFKLAQVEKSLVL